jgi:integrase
VQVLAESENDPNFERQLNEVTVNLQPYIRTHLLKRISRANASIIINYIQAYKTESNLNDGSIQATIATLKQLAEVDSGRINFREMTRDNIITFLDRLRKKDHEDSLHQWIGTYGTNVITIKRFFKWLFYPLLPPAERPIPAPITNVRKLDRKEKTIYKDTDLWLDPDCNRMFFRYVSSARDRAFHAMMLDTSCRPKELMNVKIKDLEFVDKGFNQKHAYIWVVGKSGRRTKKLLIKSLPYLRDWLSHGNNHPMPENPNAYVLCGNGNKNRGNKLERHTFSHQYIKYRKILFPTLLLSPDVPDEDKQIIKEKILTKPIRPYILRHTSLTEKAQLIGEFELRQHADWTISSPMPQRYLHFGGNESVKALLKAQGIISDSESDAKLAEDSTALRPPRICDNCTELNKPEAKFCSNPQCGMALDFKADIESIVEKENMQKKLEQLTEEQEKLRQILSSSMYTMSSMLRLFTSQNKKGEVKTTKVKNMIENASNMVKILTTS